MSSILSSLLLKKILLRQKNNSRLKVAWLALFAGITLLLIAVLIWWNFKQILESKQTNDSLGSSFLTINKEVTNENISGFHSFTQEEIEDIKKAPQVQDAAALIPAGFPANISAGGRIGFSTLLPLEAAPVHFMDKQPDEWDWKEGDVQVPVIIPYEFLNQYNFVFAPSQGLPLLSETTIKSLGFQLTIGAAPNQQQFVAHVVGFSERINSILVPESFISFYNNRLPINKNASAPSRLIMQVKDPSDKAFGNYLHEHHYSTNAEQMRWSKLRAVVDVISLATGILALLLISMSALVFLLFIELTLARAKDAVQLLLEIGYSPAVLKKFMMRRFLPVMLSAVIVAVFIAVASQFIFYFFIKKLQINTSIFPGMPLWIIVSAAIILLIWQIKKTIGNAILN